MADYKKMLKENIITAYFMVHWAEITENDIKIWNMNFDFGPWADICV